MRKIKRDLFFWIERLQITRKERVVISALLILILLMVSLSAFIKDAYEESRANYEELLTEFEVKSEAIQNKRLEDAEKYSAQEKVVEEKSAQVVTEALVININTANINELQKLNGIGKTYAQRIVDYRTENGEFKSIEELLKVKGIGKKRLDNLKAFITLK
ncbi:MAG: helix-hairpin-helix domain-containing protein [Balneola sp.]